MSIIKSRSFKNADSSGRVKQTLTSRCLKQQTFELLKPSSPFNLILKPRLDERISLAQRVLISRVKYLKNISNWNMIRHWVVVVAQLVERSLPIPEVRSLNPVIGKNLY